MFRVWYFISPLPTVSVDRSPFIHQESRPMGANGPSWNAVPAVLRREIWVAVTLWRNQQIHSYWSFRVLSAVSLIRSFSIKLKYNEAVIFISVITWCLLHVILSFLDFLDFKKKRFKICWNKLCSILDFKFLKVLSSCWGTVRADRQYASCQLCSSLAIKWKCHLQCISRTLCTSDVFTYELP